ncbi:hypothetical protein [Zavarzinia compransoris]|uniref:HNH endonuclease n=1 Tax=Zavarzinia compransoris TaxID=1264899 RepID=A0A317EAR5_9PROT|nr:hypothetical protein [Zavarzinia compransoris]PWR23781.1 hypothetical protein DKG75_04250 [Zavarzinia compransoris]TDP48011.1 hypothetical protein DES42_102308 [Zavarzinia compransoris]
MIRYPYATLAVIEALVDSEVPHWRAAARARTEAIKQVGRYVEGGPSWSDVKPVFMRLQSNKCIFCELPLGGENSGKATQDIEHFRPKNAVKAWPAPAKAGEERPTFPFATGGTGDGYYWLAYELSNYAAACKGCNTARKANYFPIAGTARGPAEADVSTLNAGEQPFLIFPLGTVDQDPESLITFEGIVAIPVTADGQDHRRAGVNIEFFGLNEREELWEDRFRVITSVFQSVELMRTSTNPSIVKMAQRTIANHISESGPHANCARSYLALLQRDRVRAWGIYEAAEASVENAKNKRAALTGLI